jgi:hypothetical protein
MELLRDYYRLRQTAKNRVICKAKVKPRPGDTVVVRTKLDTSIAIIWKDKPLLVKEVHTLFDQYK